MITEPKVTIDLLNAAAQGQITWVASHKKDFSNLNLLNISGKDSPDFLALGLNQSILNKSLSDNIRNVAYMSDTLSDSGCIFTDIFVEGTFFSPQSFYATTINFGENYPKKIKIDYYNNNDLIDAETIDEIDSRIIYTKKSITNCSKLRMTFLESWSPYRAAYLQEWLFGALIVLDNDNIISLNLLEDTDPISRTLVIDQAIIESLPAIKEFDITDPKGIYKFLKPGTRVEITTKIVTEEITKNLYLGTYFVKTIESENNKTIKINCESYLGRLDNYKFHGSLIYGSNLNTSSVKEIIKSIFNYCGISNYDIDDELSQILCTGYIPVKSCRDALKEICFVNDVTVFDNRRDKVYVRKRNEDSRIEQYISDDDITTLPQYKVRSGVSSITTTSRIFTTGTTTDLVTDITSTGIYEFRVPATNATIQRVSGSGTAILTEVSATSARATLLGSGTFKIVGTEYKETLTSKYTFDSSDSGESLNIEDCKLINYLNAPIICSRVAEYYNKNNIQLSFEYICMGQETGKKTEIEIFGKRFIGVVTHQNLDVAGGMIANAEIIGMVSDEGI